MSKIYLGDSVYLDFDGYMFVLTTENGMGASNTIYMEPSVFNALTICAAKVKDAWIEEHRPSTKVTIEEESP